jgi:S-(hydroxymethyl)glutathione dehydrogenase / alcohol dehydrogenase
MKAAVLYEFGKPLVVEEIDMDPPQKGEVKVKLAATAICHTDIHVIRGELPGPLPCVPGHESAGFVESVGEGVSLVKPGDAVVVSLLNSCGKCENCVAGLPHLCQAQWPLNTGSRLHNKKGQSLAHMPIATFAEYVIVDESQTVPIPSDVPMDSASLLACGFITGYGAVVNRAKVRPGNSVVIIGLGGVGLSAVQGAVLSGAYPIIGVDVLDTKLKTATTFGVTHTINAKKDDPNKIIRELTSGRGADYVFITVGSSTAIEQAIPMLSIRGTVVMVGLPPVQQTVKFSPVELIRWEKTITTSFMGATRFRTDVPKLIALYKAGRIKLDELISKRYSLSQINEAISSLESGEALRNVIVFHK